MQTLSLPQLHISHWPPSLFAPGGEVEEPADDASSAQSPPAKDELRTRVLVVDDAIDVSEMFGTMLRLSGYDVAVANSAIEALEQANLKQFDVIVSDIGMPEMNGYELAGRLREMPGYADVPLIAVTGFALYKDRTQAYESGFNAHLSKPVNPMTLLDTIEKLRKQGKDAEGKARQ